jgi:NDP-sugar pyrophosphorylase family protein
VEGDICGQVHIEGPVFIGPGVQIMPGAVIMGPVHIGAGSFVGPGCYVRANTIIGENVIIGNSCELKNCIVADSAQIPHWNYVGDSVIGHQAHLGAGVILSNWRHDHGSIPVLDARTAGGKLATGLAKFGAIIGDHADLGAHVVLNPGSLIGRRSVLYGGVVWRGVLPADQIVKLRQEWDVVERRPS